MASSGDKEDLHYGGFTRFELELEVRHSQWKIFAETS
jgi:hypothetical protein